MAFGDVIQSAKASSNNTGTVTVSFSAAVAANLLVATFSRSINVSGWTDPSGWTQITSSPLSSGNLSGRWYYKIAAGGETSVVGTTTETSAGITGIVAEYEGPFAASPLDQSTENEANLSTIVTSQSTGTTGTTAQADELAVAFFAADALLNVDGSRAYTNSFVEVLFADQAQPGRVAGIQASKVLSATGTVETTFSCTDTGDEMYGAIATFKKSVTGAKPWHYYAQQRQGAI